MAQDEQPQQSYYSGAKVRLIVRLDDFGTHATPKPKKPPQLRKGTKDPNALQVSKSAGAFVIGAVASGKTKSGPQAQQTAPDGFTQVIEGVIPAKLSLGRNGIRTADTLNVEFRFADLPIDPRVVRSCAIEAYIGCLTEGDFTGGLAGQTAAGSNWSGAETASRPLNVIPDDYTDGNGKQRTNLRFSGWVDEWSVDFAEGEEPRVHLECTDNTRLLIEQDAPPQLYLDGKKPLDEAVATYLANFPQCNGLSVVYQPAGDTPPKVGDAISKLAAAPQAGPTPAGGAPGGAAPEKLAVWDYLTDICGSVGHTIRVQDELVIVQKARTIYGAKFPSRPDDPFTGRVLPSGRTLTARTYIYGRNVSDMTFKRKMTRFSPQNVEVRCYSPKQKKTLIARFPEKSDRQTRVLPGGDSTADEKWIVHRVAGIEDQKTLKTIAQGIYEAVGRNELEANFTTVSLGSFGGGNLDPDALDAVPGDTVEVEVARDGDGFNTITGTEDDVTTKAEQFLRSLGFGAAFAKAYGKAVKNIAYPTSFRVRSITIDWDAGDDGGDEAGIKLTFEVVNYLEVVSDKSLPAGEEPTASPVNAKPVEVTVSNLFDPGLANI